MPNHPAQDPHCTYWTDGDGDTPVFQRPAEFDALLRLYADRQPRRVLEVGTYYGGTLKQWLRLAAPGALVASLDRYDQADNRARYPEWAGDTAFAVVIGDSGDPATIRQAARYGPYDWVFIDADHWYASVARDYAIYGALCAPGGVVALHDIVSDPRRHPEIEVSTLWAQIKATGAKTQEFVEDYGAAWGGIGVVFR